jgi:enamine deaminase RidA (YjgF/YER057c/UK114 family)
MPVLRMSKNPIACSFIVASFMAGMPTPFADDFVGVEERLRELGLAIPEPYEPFANYVAAKRVGNLVFLGGHSECEQPYITGKVGLDRTVAEGYEAARLTALCLLASLKAEIGDLDKVVQIIKVNGMVNATEEFKYHSKVINGCSDLLIEIFGERGRHARAAVGMASLPLNLTVEIEMVVEVSD